MNIPNRYNITQTYLIQQRCYYVYNNGSYQYICGNETVGVRLVLEFETLAISDGGEYTCIVNITDGNYSRTVTNRTTQLLNIQGRYTNEVFYIVNIIPFYFCSPYSISYCIAKHYTSF